MHRRTSLLCSLTAVLGLTVFADSGNGQMIINGPTAAANAASAGQRAPGNMVGRGIQRAEDRITPLGRPEITETTEPTDALDETLPEFVDAAFDELNQFLFFFLNQLLQREGFPPLVPGDITTPPDTSNGDGNGDDGSDDNGDSRDPRDPRGRRSKAR